MFNPPTHYGRRLNITYPRGRLLHFLFWVCEFSGFQIAKTSINKRLLCNCFFTLPASTCMEFGFARKFACKGTTKF